MEVSKKRFQEKLILLAETLHRRFFGEEMSDVMRGFLKNLSWSFFGGIIAVAIMFVVNILGARFLGSEGFGMYNSILSFASALTFFLLLGSDNGVVRFISDKNHQEKRGVFLTSSMAFVLCATSVFLMGSFLFYEKIDELTKGHAFLAIVLAITLALKSLVDAFLRSYQLFSKQSFLRIFDALVVILLFCFFFFLFEKKTFEYYIYAFTFGGSFFIVAGLWTFRKDFSNFSSISLRKLLSYQKYFVIIGIGGIFMGLEKYFVGKFIGLSDLGLYSVYHGASFLIIANLGSIFMNAFWPAIIRNKENMRVVLDKLVRFFGKVFIFWVILDVSFLFLVLRLSGSEYVFYPSYAISFSIISFFAFLFTVLISILNIDNVRIATIAYTVMSSFVIAAIFLSENLQAYILFQIFIYIASVIIVLRITKNRMRKI